MNAPAWKYPRHERLWELIKGDLSDDDLAHDRLHVLRVYAWAVRLAPEAGVEPDLAGAGALVHDLVAVPKESEDRPRASERSAREAGAVLEVAGYAPDEIEQVTDAVRTCSWSSGRAPSGALGRVLQDADRLDALGAVGIARTLLTAQGIQSRGARLELYHPGDPIARTGREPDDRRYALDHFFVKLLGLADGMHLPSAREEALRRKAVMEEFLAQLAREIAGNSGVSAEPV
jgi:uncharacterized protein